MHDIRLELLTNRPAPFIHDPSRHIASVSLREAASVAPIEQQECLPNRNDELHDRIETFLYDNAELFSASLDAWQHVRAEQISFKEVWAEYTDQANREFVQDKTVIQSQIGRRILNQPTTRTVRRNAAAMGQLLSTSDQISGIRNSCNDSFRSKIAPAMAKADDDKRRSVFEVQAAKETGQFDTISRRNYSDVPSVIEPGTRLHAAYLEAHYADHLALEQCRNFLRDASPEAALAFVEYIAETAPLAAKGLAEYPGLLELLAANMQQDNDKSIISEAVSNAASAPGAHAARFLAEQLSLPPSKLRKETALALTTMRFMAEKVFSADASWISQAALHWEQWPPVLSAMLESYAKGVTKEYTQHLKQCFKPFVRQGRLPARGNKLQVDSNKAIKHRQQELKFRKLETIEVASKNQDMTDVIAEVAKQPIRRFLWLNSTGHNEQNMSFTTTALDSIDTILQQGPIKKYLLEYRHDSRLKESLRAAFEKLAEDPRNANTTAWIGDRCRLPKGKDFIRIPFYRFSFQHFPGTSGTSITRDTRILYAITSQDGEPALAIYSVFHKNEVGSQTRQLPRRR